MPSVSAPSTSSFLLLFRNGGPEAHSHFSPVLEDVLARGPQTGR